jgi:hypothetical protein
MRKLVLALTAVFVGLIGGYVGFDRYFSNEGILHRVVHRSGYVLVEKANPVPVELRIRPEWIPAAAQESPERPGITLKELHNTAIKLDYVWHAGDHIQFGFSVSPAMNRRGGEFLYNIRVNPDGTYTDNVPAGVFRITWPEGEAIDYGPVGFGPGTLIVLSVNADDYERIKDGFRLEYNGLILYEYAKA